jgi:PEP-CTERM motif
MKMKPLATALLLATAALAAQAASFDLSSGPYTVQVFKTTGASFTDIYNFSVAGPSTAISGALTERFGSDNINIDWGDVPVVAIYGGWDASGGLLRPAYADPGTPAATITIASLVVPSHFSIAISGRPTGNGSSDAYPGVLGAYDLTIAAAPVPEPESYALMLAGMGVIGWLRRQRGSGR